MSLCPDCSGSGVIEVENKQHECHCAFVKRLATTMPAFIRRVDVRQEHVQLPILRQLKRNFLITATWQDMKAVIKAIMISNAGKFIKITSDREVRDVYVGSKSKSNRGDMDGSVYNSLEDLMDPPDLMIVRLNELSYKNKAAPGALEEAVSFRVDRDKPVWLFSDIQKPFTTGSHAYSDSVADLIKSSFHVQRIPRILPTSLPGEDIYESINPLPIEQQEQLPVVQVTPTNMSPAPIVKISDVNKLSPEPQVFLEDKAEIPRVMKPKPRIRPSDDVDAGTSALDRYGSGIATKNSFNKKR